MTTDITELAQSLKAAITEATPGGWYVDYDFDVCTEGCGFIAETHGNNLVHNAQYIALANPTNVKLLVEALEKAQTQIIVLQQKAEIDPRTHEIIDLKERIIETNDVLCSLLPDCRYMDPPDGGSVTPLEQVSRMIADYRQRIDELESSVIAPGIMRCAKCSFVLTKNSINMSAGTITAGDSKSEPCPNGCGPLWPVTWREQALQARDDSEQWFEDLQAAKARITELERQNSVLADGVIRAEQWLMEGTVTVKLPEVRITVAESRRRNMTWRELGAYNEGADVAAERIGKVLTAQGIKVEAE
ncbi:TPA: hypothetical protein ACIJ16_000667 [Klebsiella aerogenes]|nr:hypothetical protein [Klebsiella aerogenes]HBV9679819.1 hypothetical protein [Klebsiella aerogenes]